MILPAKRGERMPKHANAVMEDFIAFSSQGASGAVPCSHLVVTPLFALRFAKSQVGVRSDKSRNSAISDEFGPFSSLPKERLSLSTLCVIDDSRPILAPENRQ